MRRRGCLISFATLAGLALVCCLLGIFVVLPRVQDQLGDELSDQLSTEVAQQFGANPAGLDAGTYTISVEDLERELDANMDTSTAEDIRIDVDSTGMSIDFSTGNQEFGYHGVPTARDGQFVIDDMSVDNDALGWFMPADKLGRAIEDGINAYFDAEGLEVAGVTLGDGEITIEAVPAGQ